MDFVRVKCDSPECINTSITDAETGRKINGVQSIVLIGEANSIWKADIRIGSAIDIIADPRFYVVDPGSNEFLEVEEIRFKNGTVRTFRQ